jgi:hypothetical protein
VSTYPTTPTQAAGVAPSKPGTLTAAVLVAVVAGLASVLNGVLILAGLTELSRDLGAKAVSIVTGASVEQVKSAGGALLNLAAEEAKNQLSFRGYTVLAFGVLVLLFGFFMRNAATWARVLVTISAALMLVFSGAIATDAEAGTGAMVALGWVGVLGGVLAIVLAWLPANGRYAKAVKQA